MRNHRINVLNETLQSFSSNNSYYKTAFHNLQTWNNTSPIIFDTVISVDPLDWGEATLQYSKKYGNLFTVLNMANATYPGGGYKQGAMAQEENMWRRSNCSFYDAFYDTYPPHLSNLLSAQDDLVYLDTKHPRVCIRGKDPHYTYLDKDNIFPFVEMRAAAQNCYDTKFNIDICKQRINAQFNTLLKNHIKYVILGAFGCGAFGNPPEVVANLYKQQILQHRKNFNVIVFAIYYAGYGSDNYSVFKNIIDLN
jgi:uncharacterized protein (TIGR02452 family)